MSGFDADTAFAGYRLTPMLQQYVAAKRAHPDAILMFRMGDFFELFFDDAKVAAHELDLTLTSRDKGERPIPMAGVPHHAIESYIAKLVARGFTVAICDQVEDAKLAQGLVRREITRVISPGTVSDLAALEPSRATYLAVVMPIASQSDGPWAVAFLDLLAGEILTTVGDAPAAVDELRRLGAKEVLIPRECQDALRALWGPDGLCLRATEAPEPEPAAVPHAPDGARGQALGRAVAHAIRYAGTTQRRALPHLMVPKYYQLAEYLMMDEATRASLELTETFREGRAQGSLFAHLNRTRTGLGARLLRHWLLLPLRDRTAIAARADVVAALKAHRPHRTALQQALAPMRDLERLAGRVALNRANPKDIRALAETLAALPEVHTALAAAAHTDARLAPLGAQWDAAPSMAALGQELHGALVDDPPTQYIEGGVFARGYNAALDELIELATNSQAYLRRFEAEQREATGINGLKVRYNRVFGYYIEISRASQARVPADYVRRQTLANAERYVTESLKQFEQQVLEAEGRRRALEVTLFEGLIARLQTLLAELRVWARLIAQVDALAALAEVADNHRYVRPTLVEEPTCELVAVRHPVLEVSMPRGEAFVPNDVRLGQDRALLLITGPNMAGKSTLMRQVALCAIMAQMGGFVPADSATLGVCDRLFTRVGASDNLSRGHSTFMVEMIETATILQHASPHSLVLLDEIGRGTSTYDGLSIAWAVAEHLHDVNRCRTLFATHYHELTDLCRSHSRAVAVQVTVREVNGALVFLRQLEEGAADRSYGIEVAKLACLPEPVIDRARALLHYLEAPGDAATKAQSPRPTVPVTRPPPRHQLGLFAPEPVTAEPAAPALAPHEAALLEELRRLKVDHLTPLQALNLVHAWHAEAAGASASVAAPTARRARSRRGV